MQALQWRNINSLFSFLKVTECRQARVKQSDGSSRRQKEVILKHNINSLFSLLMDGAFPGVMRPLFNGARKRQSKDWLLPRAPWQVCTRTLKVSGETSANLCAGGNVPPKMGMPSRN